MELCWKEINAERLIGKSKSQDKISGELPSPDGRKPEVILGRSARVVIDSSAAETDSVRIKGSIIANVTAEDADGESISYESKACFEHCVRIEGACPGMTAQTLASIQSVNMSPSENGAAIDADVDFEVILSSSVPMKVTAGIKGIEDLEINAKKITHNRRSVIGSERIRMRDELAAEGVSEVVSSEGQIAVRDVSLEQGTASVSGVITVSAVTKDANGHLSQLFRQVPFRERVKTDSSADEVFCSAELASLYLTALGEEFALISMDADVEFMLYGINRAEIEIPVDAYSPSVGFDCLYEKALILDSRGIGMNQTTIKEMISLPDNAPELSVPLFSSAVPVVTSVNTDGNEVSVSGVLLTSVTYESTAGKRYFFNEDVPFEVVSENDFSVNMPVIKPNAVCTVTGTGDRSVQISYNVVLNTEYLNVIETSAAVGLAEKELTEKMIGVVIYFTSEGETDFDVAKRYSVPLSEVSRLNPDSVSPYREGEKLLLMV